MSTCSRRKFLQAATSIAALGVSAPSLAIGPSARGRHTSRLKLSLAAYSFRDYLTGKSEPHMTLFDFIDRAAQMDLDAVELTEYYFPKPLTSDYIARIKRQCYLLGLDISGSPMRNTFTYPPGPERDREIAGVQQWIDRAAQLGAPCVRIFAGSRQPGQSQKEAEQCCIECIQAACEHAVQRGVLLALENHGGIVEEAEALLNIVQKVNSEWCGINLDTGNFRTADPYGDLARCAPYAVSVQVKTEVQPKGQPKREADFARIVQVLKDADYRGYLTLEYEAAEEPLKAVPHYIEKLREVL
ncbi:MAG TPA: sugar phosphate isomerase/epimerase family protein [Chthonomonadales bacterium]|nr:sugar phosphate isomerase/epimerase family protein [Chthonomonadales bacterium]